MIGEVLDARWRSVYLSSQMIRSSGMNEDEVKRQNGRSLIIRSTRDDSDIVRVEHESGRAWFAHNAPGLYAAHRGRENVWNPGPGLFRTCIPAAREGHDLCVYVDTAGPNVTVTRDHDEQPNSVIAGPDNPGRQAR